MDAIERCCAICPIATPPNQRKTEVRPATPESQAKATISKVVGDVTVTALENAQFPNVAAVEVPPNAYPTCTLPERLAHAQIGVEGHREYCIYVPGQRVWLTVSKEVRAKST